MSDKYFGFIELELKPTPKVLNVLKRLGHNWVELGKPKIIYIAQTCYPESEHKAICKGNLDLLKVSRIRKEDIKKIRPAASKSLIGATEAAAGLLMERYLLQERKRVVLAQKKPSQHYCVYLLLMATSAFDDPNVKKENPDIPRSKYAIYVGQTGKNRRERFDQHVNPNNPKHSKRSKTFNKHAFSSDFDICNLTEVYRDKLGKIEGLTQYEALAKEKEVSQKLRNEFGIWSYSK
jgi:hypothetical protein